MNTEWKIAIVGVTLIFVGLIIAIIVINHSRKISNSLPEPPSNIVATSVSPTHIRITWSDESINEDGFTLYRDDIVLAELAKNTVTYDDYDVTPSTEYHYSIEAHNKNGKSTQIGVAIVSKNPPIRVTLNRIGVDDNGEDFFREIVDHHGEIYLGVIISDGVNLRAIRLPSNGFYMQADNSEWNVDKVIFYSPSAGDHLEIHFLALEHDFGGLGDDLLIEALNYVALDSLGTIPSLILAVAGVDFREQITEIGGFRDDFLGDYDGNWTTQEKWGVSDQTYYIQCDNGNHQIGLKLWFTIDSPTSNQ